MDLGEPISNKWIHLNLALVLHVWSTYFRYAPFCKCALLHMQHTYFNTVQSQIYNKYTVPVQCSASLLVHMDTCTFLISLFIFPWVENRVSSFVGPGHCFYSITIALHLCMPLCLTCCPTCASNILIKIFKDRSIVWPSPLTSLSTTTSPTVQYCRYGLTPGAAAWLVPAAIRWEFVSTFVPQELWLFPYYNKPL